MNRRRGIAAIVAAPATWPLHCGAQSHGKVHRIGWLVSDALTPGEPYRQFVRRAAELGYVEGRNLFIDYRSFGSIAEGEQKANALVRANVDLLVAQAPSALLVARKATGTIPIVTFFVGDPVQMGVVQSLARPGGNVTGFAWDSGFEGTGKLLEVMKELLPGSRRIGLLWNRENDSHPRYVEEFEKRAVPLGLVTVSVSVTNVQDFAGSFRHLKRAGAAGAIVFTDPFTILHREAMSQALALHPLPAIWQSAAWPWSAAVITYAPNVSDQPRRAAEYADRIFRGEAAGTLPFQLPSRDDFIVNVKVARSLGIVVPKSLLVRADRLIE